MLYSFYLLFNTIKLKYFLFNSFFILYYGESEEENSLIRNALLNIASKFSIKKFDFSKIEKFAEVIILILKEHLIQNSLEDFRITDCDSSDCLTILSLLSE